MPQAQRGGISLFFFSCICRTEWKKPSLPIRKNYVTALAVYAQNLVGKQWNDDNQEIPFYVE